MFHHSSAAIAAAMAATIAAIATTHTLKLPALTIILPLGEGAGLVSPAAALYNESKYERLQDLTQLLRTP